MQRLKQRFSHFQKAFLNLKEIKDNQNRIFSTLEKEGIIQRLFRNRGFYDKKSQR